MDERHAVPNSVSSDNGCSTGHQCMVMMVSVKCTHLGWDHLDFCLVQTKNQKLFQNSLSRLDNICQIKTKMLQYRNSKKNRTKQGPRMSISENARAPLHLPSSSSMHTCTAHGCLSFSTCRSPAENSEVLCLSEE